MLCCVSVLNLLGTLYDNLNGSKNIHSLTSWGKTLKKRTVAHILYIGFNIYFLNTFCGLLKPLPREINENKWKTKGKRTFSTEKSDFIN